MSDEPAASLRPVRHPAPRLRAGPPSALRIRAPFWPGRFTRAPTALGSGSLMPRAAPCAPPPTPPAHRARDSLISSIVMPPTPPHRSLTHRWSPGAHPPPPPPTTPPPTRARTHASQSLSTALAVVSPRSRWRQPCACVERSTDRSDTAERASSHSLHARQATSLPRRAAAPCPPPPPVSPLRSHSRTLTLMPPFD